MENIYINIFFFLKKEGYLIYFGKRNEEKYQFF